MTLPSVVKYKSQNGAALLVFMLALVIATSYALVTKLNAATKSQARQLATSRVLAEAKQALISYAVTYPDRSGTTDSTAGPGYLSCPDTDNDGSPNAPCGVNSVGRLPGEFLATNNYLDSTGERLWYAVSDNFRNTNIKFQPLNSETPGQLNVDGINDIVAVIIAPGEPVNAQVNRPSNNIADYLEGDNATTGDDSFTLNSGGNDQLIYITRQELMAAIEKRVLGDVKTALETYKATAGAYPWLSPFADPKAVARQVAGTADACNFPCDPLTTLNANDHDFITRGVAVGDVIYNITDGSIGTITAVAANSLDVAGLELGTDNDFDENDRYVINPKTTPAILLGTATAGGDNDTLADNSRDLRDIGAEVSDVIDNLTDGSSAIITSISANSIEIDGLTGGTDNLFQTGDVYQVRNNYGVATNGASSVTQLDDANKNFIAMGIQEGDLIHNITDDSYGTVTVVAANSLTVDELRLGKTNTFSNNDYYVLPRFNSAVNTRKGLLAIHDVGEIYESQFDLDWNALETDGATVSIYSAGNHPNYDNSIKRFAQTSSETVETVSIDDGSCIWVRPEIIDCRGSYTHAAMQGRATSGSGSGSNSFSDNTKHFINMGVNIGDIVLNYDDEDFVFSGTAEAGSTGTTLIDTGAFAALTTADLFNLMVENDDLPGKAQGVLSELVDTDTLKVVTYVGENVPVSFNAGDDYTVSAARKLVVRGVTSSDTLSINQLTGNAPDLDTGEFYGIKSATAKTTSRTIDFFGGLTLNDAGANFVTKGIQPGDIVHNTTDDAWGEIATVIDEDSLTVTQLYASDGSTRVFNGGETYEVYYSYVNTRQYKYALRFSGDFRSQGVNGVRTRDVCLGYVNCTGNPTNVALPYYNLGIFSTATAGSAGLTLNDTTTNFFSYGVKPGDTVFNITDGSNGIIDTVNTNQIIVKSLVGGTNVFSSGDSFRISRPMITVEDYDKDNNLVGNATVTIPTGGSQGSINVTGVNYGLHAEGVDLNGDGDYSDAGDIPNDIPVWFTVNDWHKLIYAAFSVGDIPGAAAACVAGTNCLTLNGLDNTGAAVVKSDNNNALIIAAGMEIETTLDSTCSNIASTAQVRKNGTINEYYESFNCDAADDDFQEQSAETTFNDQVRVVEPIP
jgi:type II secretory pathway pseudopilin PulG